MEEILRLFPENMYTTIENYLSNRWSSLQEIRYRLNQPIELVFDEKVEWLKLVPSRKDCIFVLNQLSEFSLYRMEDELREGYMTIEGGHRVGLAGKVNTLHGSVKAIQYITFMNIRIAKEQIGAAQFILPYTYNHRYYNTLLVGPPQTGKTTLIRDITRIIATGWKQIKPRKVAVIDERSEIGASLRGVPQHNLGFRTDVMDACPKAEGMMMMIRSMSPDVLVVDEIGSDDDVRALMEAVNAGVTVFCTIHGRSLAELKKRPSLQAMFKQQIFQRIVLLKSSGEPGHVQEIYNEYEQGIYEQTGCYKYEMDRCTSVHRDNHMGRIRVE